MSTYWRILLVNIEAKLKLLTAYYSKINKQIEKTNQILK